MTLFLIGWTGFIGLHLFSALRTRHPERDMRKRIGEGRYMATYSVVTILLFITMIVGYQRAPDGGALWLGPDIARTLALPLNFTAFALLFSAYLPTGHIKRMVHHPMMMATLIWSLSHLWIGGDLTKVLLFGGFAVYSIVSVLSAFRRGERVTKAAQWKGDIIAVALAAVSTAAMIGLGHTTL